MRKSGLAAGAKTNEERFAHEDPLNVQMMEGNAPDTTDCVPWREWSTYLMIHVV